MNNHARIRPSKLRSRIGFAVGSLFTLGGLFIVVPKMISTGGPVWFGVLWTLTALGMTYFYGVNTFSEQGIATDDVQFTGEFSASIEDRLGTISRLRSQGVITEDEYTERRRAILEEI